MYIFKLLLLIKVINLKSIGYVCFGNVTKPSKIRLGLRYLFMLTWFIFRVGKDHSKNNNKIDLIKSDIYKYEEGITTYVANITRAIPSWSYLDRYAHETVVCEYFDNQTKKHGFINHPMISNARLAYALRTIHLTESNSLFIDSYCKLIDGVDMMLANPDNVSAITRWPLSTTEDYEPEEIQNILCSLLLLISGFGNCYSDISSHLEESILSRYLDIYNKNNHQLYNHSGVMSHDISLNIMTNITNYYIYFVTRALSCEVDNKDIMILYIYLKVLPVNVTTYKEIDVVLTLGLIEAIVNICSNSNSPKLMNAKVMYEVATLGIVQIEYFLNNRHFYNPEIDSIKYILQTIVSSYSDTKKTVKRVLSTINTMYTNNMLKKTSSTRLDRIYYLKKINMYNNNAMKSPGYRQDTYDYWLSEPSIMFDDVNRDYPTFDYLIVYSRLNAILHTTI